MSKRKPELCFKRAALAISAAVVASGMAMGVARAETELTVYTAVEAEDLKTYAEALNKTQTEISSLCLLYLLTPEIMRVK